MSFDYHETLETVVINFSASGDNIIIPAPGDQKYIAIDFIQLVPAADVTLTYYSGTPGGVALSGPMPYKANQVITIENAMKNEHGVITCGNNAAFVVNTNAGVAVTGFARYRIYNK